MQEKLLWDTLKMVKGEETNEKPQQRNDHYCSKYGMCGVVGVIKNVGLV